MSFDHAKERRSQHHKGPRVKAPKVYRGTVYRGDAHQRRCTSPEVKRIANILTAQRNQRVNQMGRRG